LVPIIVCVSAASAMLVVTTDVPQPLRSVVVFWFLLMCPGLAFVPLLRIKDRLKQWTLVITCSLVIDTLLAGAMLYSGRWAPWWALVILVALCIVGVSLQVLVGTD
jgi:hypothetical protein